MDGMKTQADFRRKMLNFARKKDSRLILAADDISWRKVEGVLRSCGTSFAAIKLHVEHPQLWGLTHKEAIEKLKRFSGGAFIILDAKLADIDKSNAMKARYYLEQGYDAITVHGFPGKKAVSAVVEVANELKSGVLLLVAMSSPGHLFNPDIVDKLVEMAHELDVAGVVSPANQYELTAKVKKMAGKMLVLSPGIGAQGGDIRKAMEAGTDFAIVGRSIMDAEDPGAAAQNLKEQMKK